LNWSIVLVVSFLMIAGVMGRYAKHPPRQAGGSASPIPMAIETSLSASAA